MKPLKLLKNMLQGRANSTKFSCPAAGPDTEIDIETMRTKECVTDLVAHLNAHENISHFYHESGEVLFKEAAMTSHGFIEEWHRLFKAFPNIQVCCSEMEVVRPDCVTAVFQVEGTHTGGPYSFGPFPEIPVTGIHVKLDPELCTITVNDGKIQRFQVDPLGESSGPPGFYTGVGGLIF